jgi:hypothetical protein
MNHHDRNRHGNNPYNGRGAGHSLDRPDIFSSIADAARENPMSAALIGMGALWLFMGGNHVSLLGGKGRTSIIGAAAHGAGTVTAGAAQMAGGAAHGVARAGSAVASGVGSAAARLSESVSDGASQAGDYVAGTVHGVDAQTEYRNADFSGAVRGNIAELFERHPLALGLAGLALGMGVAASIPVTEKERETLGNARDAVGDRVAEATEQAKEFAGAMVTEAKQQGLGSRQ